MIVDGPEDAAAGHDPLVDDDEPSRPARSSFASNATALLVSQGFTWSLALIVTAVVPRFIGPEGLGQLRLAGSLWAIAAVVITFGTSNLIMVGLARRTDSARLVQSAMGLQILLYLLSACGVIAFSLAVGYSGTLLLVIVIVGLTPLMGTFSTVARSAFYGMERMARPARVDMICKVVSTVTIVILLVAGGRTIVMAALGVGLALFQSSLMVRGLRRETGTSVRPRFHGLREVARRAFPFFLIEATVTVYHQIDTIIISLLVDETRIGWYAVADTLIGSLIVIPALMMSALFPTLTRLTHDDPTRALGVVRQGMRLMIFTSVPVGLGMAIVSQQVTDLLFGEAFGPSGPVLAFRSLALIVMFPTMLVGNYALSINRQNVWSVITAAAIVLSIPLNLILVPWTQDRYGNGAIGGAMVYVVTELAILVLAVLLVAPAIFGRTVAAGTAYAFLAGGVMFLSTWWIRDVFLPIPVIVGAVTYIGTIVLTRAMTHDERRLVAKAWGALRRRLPVPRRDNTSA